MGTAQIVMIVLMAMSFTISAVKHSEPQEEYNAWTSLIGIIIEALILKWGGFWK